ncbi:YppE family protein [Rossellomorea aquimaris]|uniref:YppE family protein n=1 Tax=Rossellomorea aquimaris TaxID=189382 RepID=UPI001CD593B2|nr:YppE family protein [Rossellomorea aquimaris]MCA1054598.1 YppE family protein [Rossellomorea aquimaris]
MTQLITVVEHLTETVHLMMEEYKTRRESGEKGEFYEEVKPFADKAKKLNDQWKELSMEWIKEERPKHLHIPQIMNTYDNIEMLSVHCFFPESSYNRFISHHQSVVYVLETQLKELKN